MQNLIRALAVTAIFSFIVGCASGPASTSQQDATGGGVAINNAFQTTAYLLDAGDKIRVIVFGEKDLSGEFVLDEFGNLDLPLIGEIQAKGKNLQETEKNIIFKLKDGYLKDPKVSLEILNYRPFFIQGEIKNSGQYPYKAGLTVQDAVAIAGGFTYRANQKRVYVRPVGSDKELLVILGKERIFVQPGDSIRISERFF